jgi:hypothetical protein
MIPRNLKSQAGKSIRWHEQSEFANEILADLITISTLVFLLGSPPVLALDPSLEISQ